MYTAFFKHQWMGFWRSRGKGGVIAVQLVMGFVVLYLVCFSILVGYNMESIIKEVFPGKDVLMVFNGMILYYFAIDFLVRLQLQELPTLAIVPYLHLNITKNKLISFLNLSALFSIFNIIPVLVFFPFAVLKMSTDYGLFSFIMYLLTILSLVIFNNYAALYFKRLSIENLKMALIGFLFLCTIGALEYFKVFSIASLSNTVFLAIILHPLIALFFVFMATSIFAVNTRYLRSHLYLEELKSAAEQKTSTDYPFLDRFGEAGVLLALEIKLILRNKRPRSTALKCLLFLFYGILFYKQEVLDANQFWILLFPAVFMTGNLTMIYGQLMFGWQSAEFDGLLANKINMKAFFKAKFLLFTISSTILTVIVSLYGLMSWKILLVQFAAYFYNIGISSVIVLYFATISYKAVDLSRGSIMNMQGATLSRMLLSFPMLLSPYIIYFPLSLIFNPFIALLGLTIFGLTGLLTQGFWIKLLIKEFNKRKYKIATGFREK
ncbi:DUF5687 family protein [Pedobacter cryoconitis]|uniref:ABC-2 type transport system permease protein n=1 Tax=Pedobacter cryoconitis TaxID=188932 RepID=A0A7X0J201_9SPHI|nr:DUF5687 family protein [Pedobacter cryoconitis]MBB6498982.1 hypothetical protein [Pedobacter cryoconitis]